VKDTKKG